MKQLNRGFQDPWFYYRLCRIEPPTHCMNAVCPRSVGLKCDE